MDTFSKILSKVVLLFETNEIGENKKTNNWKKNKQIRINKSINQSIKNRINK